MSFSAELLEISKAYGAVRANKNVHLKIGTGTIHALVGENGAGKSTAMKILYGLVKPDSGQILLDQQEVKNWNPRKAFAYGVGMVHQHFMLAECETVHDNLVLGNEISSFGVRNRAKEKLQLEELMQATGLHVPLNTLVEKLPLGLQSRCEILKVLYRKAQLLILDEPTAVLTPQETEDFLVTLKTLKRQGHTILIVTHKLKEVMQVADEITVMRAGQSVARRQASETSIEELAELMVGRRVQMPKVKKKTAIASTQLLLPISKELTLRAGEVTGIAGIEGNGQHELSLEVHRICREKKIPLGFIPSDRHREGLVLDFSLIENLRLKSNLIQTHGVFQKFPKPASTEKELLKKFDVRPAVPSLAAQALSGGNQQKLIIARELANISANHVVVAFNPTRGVDIGAIEFIHSYLLECAEKGAAVLLISSELDELMAISHRIGVLCERKIAQWFEGPPYSEKDIGLAMLGGQSTPSKPKSNSAAAI